MLLVVGCAVARNGSADGAWLLAYAVAQNYVCKVTDFGISREHTEADVSMTADVGYTLLLLFTGSPPSFHVVWVLLAHVVGCVWVLVWA